MYSEVLACSIRGDMPTFMIYSHFPVVSCLFGNSCYLTKNTASLYDKDKLYTDIKHVLGY